MTYLTPNTVYGDVISLEKTHPRHMRGNGRTTNVQLLSQQQSEKQGADSIQRKTTFGNLLFQALNTVNTLQNRSLTMNEKLVTDPNAVNIHEVTIALAEANLSLSISKTIAERAISAYREIISIR